MVDFCIGVIDALTELFTSRSMLIARSPEGSVRSAASLAHSPSLFMQNLTNCSGASALSYSRMNALFA
ncbi:hypothetical protein ACVWXN_006296 [Bradyrhizobium sp. i1.4.4]